MCGSDAGSLTALAQRIAELYESCDALLVLGGAGLGVDSGIGTFRGDTAGVWEGLARHDLPPAPDGSTGLSQVSCTRWFAERPEMAWEFWRWCHAAFCGATPHAGYAVLRTMMQERAPHSFAVTTNIDSQFAKSGVDPLCIRELHGTVQRIRCSGMGRAVSQKVLGTEDDLRPLDFTEDYDDGEVCGTDPCTYTTSFDRLGGEAVPRCPCGAVLRPDVTLFGDVLWPSAPPPGPHRDEHTRYLAFREGLEGCTRLLVLELGAGTVHNTLRKLSAELAVGGEERGGGATVPAVVVRVNTAEPEMEGGLGGAEGSLAVPYGAADVLAAVWGAVEARRGEGAAEGEEKA